MTVSFATDPTVASDTMLAAVQSRYAGPEHIALRSVDRPLPGEGEVLIAVQAAGVDRGVWHMATGRPFVMRIMGFGLRRPGQPVQGSDVAGVVEAVGVGVTDFVVGDRVFGSARGSYAEYAVASADQVALMPKGLTFAEAASVPVSGIAAQAAVGRAGVSAGRRVLVLGASGGVGSFAVQLAVAAGAHVTGVASAAKSGLVRDLGATEVVDYRTTDIAASGREFDAIIDTGGLTPLRRLRRILAPEGTLVIVGGEGGGSLTGGVGRQLLAGIQSLVTRQTLTGLMSVTSREALDSLRDSIEAGRVRPAVTATYPLERAADAISDLVAGRIAGKASIAVGKHA